MKFAITADDKFKALVDVTIGEKDLVGDQPFSGNITTDAWGVSQITAGQVQPGSGLFIGKFSLRGVDADFSAKIEGDKISGQISYVMLWRHHTDFEGVETT